LFFLFNFDTLLLSLLANVQGSFPCIENIVDIDLARKDFYSISLPLDSHFDSEFHDPLGINFLTNKFHILNIKSVLKIDIEIFNADPPIGIFLLVLLAHSQEMLVAENRTVDAMSVLVDREV